MAMRTMWRLFTAGVVLLLASICFAEDEIQAMEHKQGLDAELVTNIRLQMIGQRVAWAAGMPNIRFRIVNENDLNAFALPDGRVYTTNLMAHAVTDDELAFVLGHEITHVKEKHSKSQNAKATGGAILGAILAAALGGSQKDIELGANIMGGLTLGHYSQKDENRADAGGIRWMARAGYDPTKAADAMQRLIDKYGAGDAGTPVLGWFATHPDTKNRKKNLQNLAKTLLKNPPDKIPDPKGIEIHLSPSAEHARPWLHDFFAWRIAATATGKYVVLPDTETAPRAPSPSVITPAVAPLLVAPVGANHAAAKAPPAAKVEPLPPVTLVVPRVPAVYSVLVELHPTPAGGAATLETAQGTAVEATLRWTELPNGRSGMLTADAQSTARLSWRADEQLAPMNLTRIYDGNNANLEGTLEAVAVRRAAMAFAEILEAGGPVEHSIPVAIPTVVSRTRPGDYVDVVRGGVVVSEVRIDAVDRGAMNGAVLWGTPTWKKGDQFVAAE